MYRPQLGEEISKITIGPDIKDGMTFKVGNAVGTMRISKIERNENNFFLMGAVMYMVYVKKNDYEYVWKTFENVPITVEYKI
jgi:hypothetical protein